MSLPGGGLSEVDQLLLDVATTGRELSEVELQRVLEHVARAGFDPQPNPVAGGRLAGLPWRGRTLRGNDRLPSAEVHYLRHVVKRNEWPLGTTLVEYLASLSQLALDPASGVVLSLHHGAYWQVAIVRRSGGLRGPEGAEWAMVEYRIGFGYWVTGMQPALGLAHFQKPGRRRVRWLRQPRY